MGTYWSNQRMNILEYLELDIESKINYKVTSGLSIAQIATTREIDSLTLRKTFKKYHIGTAIYYKYFAKYLYWPTKSLGFKTKVMSIIDIAKILKDLRHRKDLIENWKSFKDLWIEAGKPIKLESFNVKLSRNLKQKLFRTEIAPISREGIIGKLHKIHPQDYDNLLQQNIKDYTVPEGMTIKEISLKTGYSKAVIRNKANLAKKHNLLDIKGGDRGYSFYILEKDIPRILNLEKRAIQGFDSFVGPLEIPKTTTWTDNWLESFEPLFKEAAKMNLPNMSFNEKKELAQSCFFEMISENKLEVLDKGNLFQLQKQMMSEIKDEKPSWLSINQDFSRTKDNSFTLEHCLS